MGYIAVVKCKECDALLWSDRSKSMAICPECEDVDSDSNADLEDKLDALLMNKGTT